MAVNTRLIKVIMSEIVTISNPSFLRFPMIKNHKIAMYSEGSIPSKQWRNKPPTVNGSAREEIIAKMENVYNVLAVQFAGVSGINLIKYKLTKYIYCAIFTKSNEKR